MERNAQYLLVGLFVSVISIVGMVMFVYFAGSYDTREFKRYTVYFEGSVSGLSEGSAVSYRGVNVGEVESIRLDPERPERIKTLIKIDENTPVSTSSLARLQAVGITGLSALAIETQNANGEPLKVKEGERYPVIESAPSGLGKLLEDAPQISENVLAVLHKVNTLLSDKNIDNVTLLLTNLEELSGALNDIVNGANENKIADTVASFRRTADNIEQASASIKDITLKNEKHIENFTGDNLNQVSLLVQETREMVANIRLLAQRLSNDPSQIIYQPGYKGVKIDQ